MFHFVVYLFHVFGRNNVKKYLSKKVKVITLVCFWISGKSPRDCRELHKMKNRRTGNEVRNSTGFAEFGLVCIFAKKQFPSWSLTKKKYICVWALLVRWKRCCRWHYAHQYTGHHQECVPPPNMSFPFSSDFLPFLLSHEKLRKFWN